MTQHQNCQDVADDAVSCDDVADHAPCIELEADGLVVDFDAGVRRRRGVCDVAQVKDVHRLECVLHCRGFGENYNRKPKSNQKIST